jgi:hypothetical protein
MSVFDLSEPRFVRLEVGNENAFYFDFAAAGAFGAGWLIGGLAYDSGLRLTANAQLLGHHLFQRQTARQDRRKAGRVPRIAASVEWYDVALLHHFGQQRTGAYRNAQAGQSPMRVSGARMLPVAP